MDSKTDSPSGIKTKALESLRSQIQTMKDAVRRLLEMTQSLPKGEAQSDFIAAITSLSSMADSTKQTLDFYLRQETSSANSGKPVQGPRDDVAAAEEFDERLENLRHAIKSESSLKDRIKSKSFSKDRKEIVTARIRHFGWVFSAVVFMAILFKGWNGQTTDLPGTVFISILVSAAIVGLVELIVLAVRRLMS